MGNLTRERSTYTPPLKSSPPAISSTSIASSKPHTSKIVLGLISVSWTPVTPSVFSLSNAFLIAKNAGTRAPNEKIIIRNPMSLASSTVINGLWPFSTIFSNRGHGARSCTALRASSLLLNPSSRPTSAPASRAARKRVRHSSYPCCWFASVLAIRTISECALSFAALAALIRER